MFMGDRWVPVIKLILTNNKLFYLDEIYMMLMT